MIYIAIYYVNITFLILGSSAFIYGFDNEYLGQPYCEHAGTGAVLIILYLVTAPLLSLHIALSNKIKKTAIALKIIDKSITIYYLLSVILVFLPCGFNPIILHMLAGGWAAIFYFMVRKI